MAQHVRELQRRGRRGKPYVAGGTAWLIATIAVKTGISPRELLETPPDILAAIIDQLFPRRDIKTGEDAWQALERMVSE
jgi:hypothetical protein